MKYFIVEGMLINPTLMTENIMKQHMEYSQKAMEAGLILMSGLKEDMSGGVFIMKAESLEEVENYLSAEPFQLAKIQNYRVIEYSIHYLNKLLDKW